MLLLQSAISFREVLRRDTFAEHRGKILISIWFIFAWDDTEINPTYRQVG